jgi:transposase
LPKSKIGESLLAHLIVSKFDDRQPFYHLEKQLKHRAGLALSRQTMARAAIESAQVLQPLVNLLKDRIIAYDIGALDATTLQVLKEPGRAPTVKSSVYCMRGGPPGQEVTVYAYNALDHKTFIDDWFAGFGGTLHCDADPVFERLFTRNNVNPSYCHAHARRQFEPIAKASKTPGLALQAMQYYQRLYRLERLVKKQAMTPAQRWAYRQEHAQPLMDAFHAWLVKHAPTVLPKSPLGQAFQYVLSRWDDFGRFLTDGRLEIDNNLTEQAIKPLVMARKSFLFADSVAGARALCVHMSLIRTAKVHGLDPYRYYDAILTTMPHCTTVEDMEALLPWRIVLTHQKMAA